MMLELSPEIVAALEAIRIVECKDDRQTACGRDGKPKAAYSSAACARRAVLLWTWRKEVTLAPGIHVVYECAWCGDWHHGRANERQVGALAA